jgi:DNA-directed RNA polymerase subunit L
MALLTDIEVDALVAAQADLRKANELADGELEDLESADADLTGAISAIEEEGSLQRSLEHAIGCCEDVVEIVEHDIQYVVEMHRAGRINRADETVEAVVEHMRDGLRHIQEWASGAHDMLRGLR